MMFLQSLHVSVEKQSVRKEVISQVWCKKLCSCTIARGTIFIIVYEQHFGELLCLGALSAVNFFLYQGFPAGMTPLGP